ncbi:hydroxyacid dehydrogenase [Verminephrobacter eiseniae]|uniref:D-isomer specific 2-hydroxyacid dehydrogenase, NAD-binding n=1 Tax=Verminephrobacter eiseniae (strain EF01-2) TaxID=391735 RepID=A1WGB3_VEREI|nr:hydroxyacid dehydrogenase [Verminephrobacter eiseniae]ABM56670.1 D-isomer specific 2-hydroxyacid dehydrogenase, NAD-binding [Verminephrobacter eiseniae EF01-2]MCW5287028.1 3-phosphoglycerate dehydrogenase [Verminephrobacter eiseniae]MCW5305326.1 3-phosphoglycerate dehydrogenase [Verminephrobacter eiseniae]MCW8179685.1 3-phosphoglycerate dehydrogenase [Verminephrobacter eiseniae]MCW8189755.1 3-phosphoglycerate dehydrogenase [Verminephrobacter eiseniae]
MARIVIAEFMDPAALEPLRARHELLYEPQLVDDGARLQREAAGADALIVRNRTQVRGALLAALQRCQAVGRLGAGLDNIDVAGCQARGIRVLVASGANAPSVAEYVIAAALLLLRGAYGATAALASGHWPRAALSNGREFAGKTLGLVGFGAIGQLTARSAAALGVRTMACDALLGADHPAFAQTGTQPVGLDELVAQADVVSLHVPLLATTRGLFDADRIGKMKPGAVLINSSRGGIVDQAAVAAALRAGRLGGAALDVFDTEPLAAAAQFQDCPNLLLTPHIAGVTTESNQRVSRLIAQQLLEVLH